MKIQTKIFGEINIDDEKIIHLENGLIDFPYFQDFALLFEKDNNSEHVTRWLQSMQDGNFAIRVMDPLCVLDDYDPLIDEDQLAPLGTFSPDDLLVLVIFTIPAEATRMTVNTKEPILINVQNNKACQVIAENEEYEVRFPVYDILY